MDPVLDERDETVIRLLADGRFHSGQALGDAMGISRAAVWKRLKGLAALGLFPESVRGRGYRLPGGLQLLDEGLLARQVPELAGVSVSTVTGSTNADLLRHVAEGGPLPWAILAEHQLSGRGRRGRTWESAFGQNLYLSLACPFPGGVAALEGLSLVVGIAVAQALEALSIPDVGLKWPNDLVVAGRKLGGILIELAGDFDGQCVPVIGIGLNRQLPWPVGQAIEQPWTDLATVAGVAPDRQWLAEQVLRHLLQALARFREGGFAAFRQQWECRDVCVGQPVRILLGEREDQGVALGVTEQGALRVRVAGEERLYHGGEVSLRRA